ncbi:hypothetical protein ACS0TY_020684 [Phlomoides rotata]
MAFLRHLMLHSQKRGSLLKFLMLGGGSILAYASSQATRYVLLIVKGPQLPPKLRPRDKI